jgi:hypothetical protein
MKTYVPLGLYLAEFFSEWEMFQTKAVEETKTHKFNNFFSQKSCSLRHNIKKCGSDRQVTDDNIIRRMRFRIEYSTEYYGFEALMPRRM